MTDLLLIGCGKMGGAMLEGWLDQGVDAHNITVIEPSAELARALSSKYGIKACSEPSELPEAYSPDVVVLAVKPQIMDSVLPPYRRLVEKQPVFLSIAAGRTLASFEAILGSEAAVVRAMPNTPASVGRAITVGCPNPNVSESQRELCGQLLQSVGAVEWVTDEKHMDAVTAVSGSGPAYIFLLAEVMGKAGEQAGLPQDLATKLARATVSGAGELLHQSPEAASTLRENVTSPGGTTAAALDVLMGDPGMQDLLTRAIAAATKRSEELAS